MNRPLKVLHVLPSLDESYGGPLRLVLDLSTQAEGEALTSEVLGMGSLSVRDNPLPVSRIHAISANGDRFAFSADLRPWLRSHVRQFQGVVVHGAWTYPNWAVAQECTAAGVPFAYYPHGMLERWAIYGQGPLKAAKKWAYWLARERHVAKSACCTFFTTEIERQRTVEVFGEFGPSRLLRPYGLGLDPVAQAFPDNPALTQTEGATIGLFLGRLHPKKNVEFLIEAWAQARMTPPARLVIAGSGEPAYEKYLRDLAQRRLGPELVQFTGFVSGSDKRYLLQRADWFLLSSKQENFGVAVLEAVEQGCAVAISDQVYLCESFRPQSEVLPLKLDAWTRFFAERFGDPTWRDQTRDEDRTHLAATYRLDQILNQWRDTLTMVFGDHRVALPAKTR